jgi:hypothetical protein
MEEWHPQYAFNKSRASDDSTKNHSSFSVSTVISNPGLDKFSYVPNLHDVATILLTKQMIESMKKSGEDVLF